MTRDAKTVEIFEHICVPDMEPTIAGREHVRFNSTQETWTDGVEHAAICMSDDVFVDVGHGRTYPRNVNEIRTPHSKLAFGIRCSHESCMPGDMMQADP